jgi:hypothetical protein
MPELIDRAEILTLRERGDGARAVWPDEAWSEWWHNSVFPTVGARVLLALRVAAVPGWQLAWAWGAVYELRRFRALVELLQPVPGTSLMVGEHALD